MKNKIKRRRIIIRRKRIKKIKRRRRRSIERRKDININLHLKMKKLAMLLKMIINLLIFHVVTVMTNAIVYAKKLKTVTWNTKNAVLIMVENV